VSTVHGNLVNAVDETEKRCSAGAAEPDPATGPDASAHGAFAASRTSLPRRAAVRQEVGKRANLDIKGTQSISIARCSSASPTVRAPAAQRRDARIESPDKRRGASKPEIGEIRLELKQEGNEVHSRFGRRRGPGHRRIREKAIEKGSHGSDTTLTEAEIADFIFSAGFSTADVVTQLAGAASA